MVDHGPEFVAKSRNASIATLKVSNAARSEANDQCSIKVGDCSKLAANCHMQSRTACDSPEDRTVCMQGEGVLPGSEFGHSFASGEGVR